MPGAEVDTLPYSPPRHGWRRIRRRWAVLLCVLATLLSLWAWRGRWAWGQAKLLHWQRLCLNYDPPADEVVSEPGAARATLLADAAHYSDPLSPLGLPGVAVRKPPAAWERLARAVSSELDGVEPLPLVYLHERRTASGLRRLIVVYHVPYHVHGGTTPFLLICAVIEPAPLTGRPRLLSTSGFWGGPADGDPSLGPWPSTRYFAGRSDPKDPAGFTLHYETAGRRGAITGRLQDDGRSLAFAFLNGPANDASAWPGCSRVVPVENMETVQH